MSVVRLLVRTLIVAHLLALSMAAKAGDMVPGAAQALDGDTFDLGEARIWLAPSMPRGCSDLCKVVG